MPSRKDKLEREVGQGGHPRVINFLETEEKNFMEERRNWNGASEHEVSGVKVKVWSWRQCSPVLKARGDSGREGSKGNMTLGNESWVPWSCLGGTTREEANEN